MNCVHVLLQNKVILEELPTGDALVRLLLEVDGLVVPLHVSLEAEDLAAQGVGAGKLLTQEVHRAVVLHHGTLGRKQLGASGIDALNLADHRRLLVANFARCA